MTLLIDLDEGTAARRRVPMRLFTSDGTSPDTGAAGDAMRLSKNGGATATAGATVTAVDATDGQYYVELAAGEVDTLGTIAVWHDAGAFAQHVANVNVVNFNPMSTQSNDLSLRPTTAGRTLDVTAGGAAGVDWANVEGPTTEVDLSATTIKGITNDSVITIAGTTNTATLINALNDIDGSGVTLHAGVHSNATIQGIDNDSVITIAGVTNTATLIGALNDIDGSGVTLHEGVHSGATIDGVEVTTVNTDMVGTDGAMLAGSTVTLSDGGLDSAKFAAGAIDAAALATDAGQEIADRVMVRNIEGGNDSGRTVGEALAALRNRVQVSDVSLIVYRNDDSTVWWHGSISTTDSAVFLTDVDPDV